jgi:hypothetical protein
VCATITLSSRRSVRIEFARQPIAFRDGLSSSCLITPIADPVRMAPIEGKPARRHGCVASIVRICAMPPCFPVHALFGRLLQRYRACARNPHRACQGFDANRFVVRPPKNPGSRATPYVAPPWRRWYKERAAIQGDALSRRLRGNEAGEFQVKHPLEMRVSTRSNFFAERELRAGVLNEQRRFCGSDCGCVRPDQG